MKWFFLIGLCLKPLVSQGAPFSTPPQWSIPFKSSELMKSKKTLDIQGFELVEK